MLFNFSVWLVLLIGFSVHAFMHFGYIAWLIQLISLWYRHTFFFHSKFGRAAVGWIRNAPNWDNLSQVHKHQHCNYNLWNKFLHNNPKVDISFNSIVYRFKKHEEFNSYGIIKIYNTKTFSIEWWYFNPLHKCWSVHMQRIFYIVVRLDVMLLSFVQLRQTY